jgi:hypothetical protein
MNRARSSLVLAGAGLLALGLTACDKPNPGASVFSGTTSQFQRAACWSEGEAYLDATTCAEGVLTQAAANTGAIPVLAGRTIGISVDPSVADVGWFPVLGDQRLTPQPVTSTYFRFAPTQEQLSAGNGTLAVIAGDAKGSRGVWVYRLTPA